MRRQPEVVTMPNENEARKPAGQPQVQKAPEPNVNLAGRHPDVIAKDPYYARHEAAHGITIDDKKWVVSTVNLDTRQTHADTKAFIDAVNCDSHWDRRQADGQAQTERA
jgi:hypothetical protein